MVRWRYAIDIYKLIMTALVFLLFILVSVVLLPDPNNCWKNIIALIVLVVAAGRLIEIYHTFLLLLIDKSYAPSNIGRVLANVFWNYFDVILIFACFYLLLCASIDPNSIRYGVETLANAPFAAIYFSTVTMTTLGYVDFKPISPLAQALTIIQVALGLLMVLMVIPTLTGMRGARLGSGPETEAKPSSPEGRDITPLIPWFPALVKKSVDGVQGAASTSFRLGAVAVLRDPKSGNITLVRKAKAEGYEFSDQWVLPGGMLSALSSADSAAALRCLRARLAERVEREAGFRADPADLLPLALGQPPITRFHRGQDDIYSAVIPFVLCATDLEATTTTASSTVESRALNSGFPWEQMAPANALILAGLVWSELDDAERNVARPFLGRAADVCRTSAESIGLPVFGCWFDTGGGVPGA